MKTDRVQLDRLPIVLDMTREDFSDLLRPARSQRFIRILRLQEEKRPAFGTGFGPFRL
jgi:hypothetical protein